MKPGPEKNSRSMATEKTENERNKAQKASTKEECNYNI